MTKSFSDEELEDFIELLTMIQGYILEDEALSALSKTAKLAMCQRLSGKCDNLLDIRQFSKTIE